MQRKDEHMFWILVVIFIVVPAIELWGLITVGSWIGPIPTILLVIFTGIVGVYFAKREGLSTWRKAQEQMSRGEMPGDALLDGACILVGGVLLLTPGFFTDVTGFLLVFPYSRKFIRFLLKKWMFKRVERMMQRQRHPWE
jgi:UPF0716 protein FxsA